MEILMVIDKKYNWVKFFTAMTDALTWANWYESDESCAPYDAEVEIENVNINTTEELVEYLNMNDYRAYDKQ